MTGDDGTVPTNDDNEGDDGDDNDDGNGGDGGDSEKRHHESMHNGCVEKLPQCRSFRVFDDGQTSYEYTAIRVFFVTATVK